MRLSCFASFSSLTFRAGLTLRFSCALRIIIAGLIWSRGDTMYYKKWPAREGVVAIVIIGSAICLVLGGSLGFLLGAICTMASDKNQRAEGEVKSSVGKNSIVAEARRKVDEWQRPKFSGAA